MRHTLLLTCLFALSLAGSLLVSGCPEKDPVEEAMEEMDFSIDIDAISIGDAAPDPEPMVRPSTSSSGTSETKRSSRRSGKTISEDDVVGVVRKKKGQVRSCYEKELKGNPDLSGLVQVAWTVTASGGVSNVQILANSTGNHDMEGCIERTIGGWNFPASRGSGVDIEYPFRFVPGG
jgi:outer membrane biosynthesis protein TonB